MSAFRRRFADVEERRRIPAKEVASVTITCVGCGSVQPFSFPSMKLFGRAIETQQTVDRAEEDRANLRDFLQRGTK